MSLQDFKDYIIEEYSNDIEYAACQFKFFHNNKVKEVKLTKKMIKEGITDKPDDIAIDTIRVSIKFVDSELNGLLTKSISFENNELSTTCKNKLVNISSNELENKFVAALPEIIQLISEEYNEIINEHNEKLASLMSYAKSANVDNKRLIPGKFINKSIPEKTKTKNKQEFDM